VKDKTVEFHFLHFRHNIHIIHITDMHITLLFYI